MTTYHAPLTVGQLNTTVVCFKTPTQWGGTTIDTIDDASTLRLSATSINIGQDKSIVNINGRTIPIANSDDQILTTTNGGLIYKWVNRHTPEIVLSGVDKVTIKLPTNLIGPYTLNLPTSDGDPNNMLITDGIGNLKWAEPPRPAKRYTAIASKLDIGKNVDIETSLFNIDSTINNIGTLSIPADYLQMGDNIRITIAGKIAGGGSDIVVRFKLGDTVVGSSTFTPPLNETPDTYFINGLFTVRSIGISGYIAGVGKCEVYNTSNSEDIGTHNEIVAINTTKKLNIDITIQHITPSNARWFTSEIASVYID